MLFTEPTSKIYQKRNEIKNEKSEIRFWETSLILQLIL